jgi:hypothetical protein
VADLGIGLRAGPGAHGPHEGVTLGHGRARVRALAFLAALVCIVSVAGSADAARPGEFIQTPTGNIICQFSDTDGIYCVIFSLRRDVKVFSSGRVRITGRAADPGEGANFVLRYGRSTSASGVRCTSRFTGLTCVSTTSGRGAVMSRSGVTRV